MYFYYLVWLLENISNNSCLVIMVTTYYAIIIALQHWLHHIIFNQTLHKLYVTWVCVRVRELLVSERPGSILRCFYFCPEICMTWLSLVIHAFFPSHEPADKFRVIHQRHDSLSVKVIKTCLVTFFCAYISTYGDKDCLQVSIRPQHDSIKYFSRNVYSATVQFEAFNVIVF